MLSGKLTHFAIPQRSINNNKLSYILTKDHLIMVILLAEIPATLFL